MSRVKRRKAVKRLEDVMCRAREIVQQLADGTEDPLVCYGRLHKIYSSHNIVHDQFKPFFEIPGVNLCESFVADYEFRTTIRRLARGWLAKDVESATPAALRQPRRTG